MGNKFYTNVHRHKNNILLRGYDENGYGISEKVQYKPYLFLINEDGDFRTLDGRRATKKVFEGMREAKEFLKELGEVSNFEYYGMTQWIYPFIFDNYRGEIKYDPTVIKVANIDIEVASDDGFPDITDAIKEVTAICLRFRGFSHVFGCGDYKTNDPNVRYVKCVDEEALLRAFLAEWNIIEPDVVTGWNVEFFDIPYLVNRITNMLGEDEAKRLSPWSLLEEKTITSHGRDNQVFIPVGVSILDYYNLYKKFTYTQQESYKLDHIAFVEIGERKLDFSEHETLLELYKNDYQKFIDYNIHDCALVERIDDKLKLIELTYAIAYNAKVNFADALTSVRLWDVIIHNYLLERRVVIPQSTPSTDEYTVVGGYVKTPQLGLHNWVVSFDLNSLYPHLIMQYNISPEMYAGRLLDVNGDSSSKEKLVTDILNGDFNHYDEYKEDHAITANYGLYKKEKQGFLPALMEKMYADRKAYKDQMLEVKQKFEETSDPELEKDISRLHNMQMAKKIQLNSAYGALANQYFRWFDTRHAEAITMSGQLSIRWIERDINKYLNRLLETSHVDYVIASDTDSIYVSLDALVSKFFTKEDQETKKDKIISFLDKACETKIQAVINKSYDVLARYVGAYQQKMIMKREVIANKGIWRGKKMYILNVSVNEDVWYKEPKLKTMGIESVRSSTPAACRENIKKALKIIMEGTEQELIKFIDDFRNEFYNLPFDAIAFPRGVNGMNKYHDAAKVYKKGSPIHVKGALIYNYLLKKHKIGKKFPAITDGDKIKFSYLKIPNPAFSSVISVPGLLPQQFELEEYIDYDMQFDKAFLEPIKSITDVIGWKTEKKLSLEGFFRYE
jgi:DNA polymerase elongation subunit (family B)